eukprot:CAMPEP_0184489700 /NCGR_PEP_ID=MMETSP0113_2-20130426/16163_1 /TAXON_ID=91329 /ORGANISM="Norrisiella sphaerica, Strain BC52" /LENGTH=240 /DNA_ID=CAMNT_0026873275 /DNA_START=77 /DNA_END=799 /DNA_ORIENTATION=+
MTVARAPESLKQQEKSKNSGRFRWITRINEKTRGLNTQLNSLAIGKVPAAIIVLQSVGLIGAAVTGYLSAKRRNEIESLNEQLRAINAELRSRETALIEKDAMLSYVEKHQDSREDSEEDQLTPEEKNVFALIEDGNKDIEEGRDAMGIEKLSMALLSADKLQNRRFSVNTRRALANGYKKLGEYDEAMTALQTALKMAEGYPEAVHSRVALTGEVADLYTEMGDLKKAAEYYDMWLAGM